MSGTEPYPGNSAFESDRTVYGSQLFEPDSLLAELKDRQQLLGDFVTREVNAYHLHQSIGMRLTEMTGKSPEERTIPYERGTRLYYPQLDYNPVPDSEDDRYLIRLGTLMGSRNIKVPLMSVSTVKEAKDSITPPSDRSFIRVEMAYVHKMLASGQRTPNKEGLIDSFLGRGEQDPEVKKALERQQHYVHWLGNVATYLEMPMQLRTYYPSTRNISLQ